MSGAAGVGHLSIGEVLSLVQQDFPDVTISKIRFLESQGLIAPERTAAGYRKFYDSDIERLRWILSQQRDHFLPLKVIRKMLDQGVDVAPSSETQPTLWTAAATGPTGAAGSEEPDTATSEAEHASLGSEVAAYTGTGPTIDVTDPTRGVEVHSGTQSDEDRERSAYRSPAHPAVVSAARPAGPTSNHGGSLPATSRTAGERASDAVVGPDNGPDSDREKGAEQVPVDSGAGSTPRAEASGTDSPQPRPQRAAYATPADVVAALQEEPRSRRRGPSGPGGPEPRSGAGDEPGGSGGGAVPERSGPAVTTRSGGRAASDVRMGRDELCASAGITPELLGDLESFGLIEPTVLGGDPQYDGLGLEVAKLAARYAELGVGARHLRMYKVAAEREAGFIEQLVVPLIKQRNPEAHAEARTRGDELQQMGAELHAVVLRRRIGPSLGD